MELATITLTTTSENDVYITIETEKKKTTYKGRTRTKTTGICYGFPKDLTYESEVIEATFLKEEEVSE